ncbi:hypothetical protein HZH66_005530 [Vespula vulgaris]|uniref:Uncharacterized protein n=1 Tax=Vespula vulgaris TaxID=7454 RepID=A0A834K6Y4_VESVU|nr:hypothetical protein HZH66_005530 [Vespula vulgaris]
MLITRQAAVAVAVGSVAAAVGASAVSAPSAGWLVNRTRITIDVARKMIGELERGERLNSRNFIGDEEAIISEGRPVD